MREKAISLSIIGDLCDYKLNFKFLDFLKPIKVCMFIPTYIFNN